MFEFSATAAIARFIVQALNTVPRFAAAVVLTLGFSSFAQANVDRCGVLFSEATQPIRLEVAEEIETRRHAAITALMVPDSDLVIDLVAAENQPAFFSTNAPDLARANWRSLLWSTASAAVKEAVLAEVGKKSNFAVDRAIPHFKMKERVFVIPANDVKFLGQELKANFRTELDLRGFLNTTVEYAAGSVTDHASWVEMHFRGANPMKLIYDIRTFFDSILPHIDGLRAYGNSPQGEHMHIVARRPDRFTARMLDLGFSKDAVGDALALFHSVIELNMIITQLENEPDLALFEVYPESDTLHRAPPLMSFLQRKKMDELRTFFRAVVQGKKLKIDKYGEVGTSLKKNNAGARWGSTYSDDSLWGVELRFPNYEETKRYAIFASNLKDALDRGLFFTDERLRMLPGDFNGKGFSNRVWFSLDPQEIMNELGYHPTLAPKAQQITQAFADKFINRSQDNMPRYSQAYLVMFDWAHHPLVPESMRPAIWAAQERQFDSMIKYNGLFGAGALNFFEESGLRELFEGIINEASIAP